MVHRCKGCDYSHYYTVCKDCGHEYCDKYWKSCPRCNGSGEGNRKSMPKDVEEAYDRFFGL